MKRYLRNYLYFVGFYAVFTELFIYGSVHEWQLDPFLYGNAVAIMLTGAIVLFTFGMWGLIEGFWD